VEVVGPEPLRAAFARLAERFARTAATSGPAPVSSVRTHAPAAL
jgi:hypothetical protein